MKKLELEQKVAELTEKLAKAEAKPTYTISNCHIDASRNETAIAIANAVKSGMDALKAIGDSKSYGIYIGDDK